MYGVVQLLPMAQGPKVQYWQWQVKARGPGYKDGQLHGPAPGYYKPWVTLNRARALAKARQLMAKHKSAYFAFCAVTVSTRNPYIVTTFGGQ